MVIDKTDIGVNNYYLQILSMFCTRVQPLMYVKLTKLIDTDDIEAYHNF